MYNQSFLSGGHRSPKTTENLILGSAFCGLVIFSVLGAKTSKDYNSCLNDYQAVDRFGTGNDISDPEWKVIAEKTLGYIEYQNEIMESGTTEEKKEAKLNAYRSSLDPVIQEIQHIQKGGYLADSKIPVGDYTIGVNKLTRAERFENGVSNTIVDISIRKGSEKPLAESIKIDLNKGNYSVERFLKMFDCKSFP